MKNKSKIRMTLMVMGLVHLIAYFVLPYGKLSGLMGGLGDLGSALGLGDMYPKNLTGLAVSKMSDMLGGGSGVTFLFLIPVILGLLVLALNLMGKGRLSYGFSVGLSLVSIVVYGIIMACIAAFAAAGYGISFGGPVLLALSVAQFVVSVVGCVKNDGGKAKASGGKNVKAGRKDGKLIGVRGTYMGAEIPVKSGDKVVIGRDPSVCSIVVKDEKASRRHCEVSYNADNGMYMVTDQSSNGTFGGDGKRLPERTAVPMSAGSTIQIGKDGDVFRLG